MNFILRILAIVHQICPLCVISRRFPQSKFSKAVFAWGRICPFCSLNRLAVKRGLVKG